MEKSLKFLRFILFKLYQKSYEGKMLFYVSISNIDSRYLNLRTNYKLKQ